MKEEHDLAYWKAQAELWYGRWRQDAEKHFANAKGDVVPVVLVCPSCGNRGATTAHLNGLPAEFKTGCDRCSNIMHVSVDFIEYTEEQWQRAFVASVYDDGTIRWWRRE